MTIWDQLLDETETSTAFQFNTGWDVAADLHDGDPRLTMLDTIELCKTALAQLGEPEPTEDEMMGMVGYFVGLSRMEVSA